MKKESTIISQNKNNDIKILFMLSIVGDTRDSKRIKMLQNAGFYVEAIGFQRKRSKESGRSPDCDICILSEIYDGQYINRLYHIIKNIPVIRNKIINADIIFASRSDMAFMSIISKIGIKCPVIIEVADIREIQTEKSLRGNIYRFIDRLIINSSQLLVVTSKGFYEEYYNKWIKVTKKYIVIENKLESDNDRVIQKRTVGGEKKLINKYRIGYFGVLRCEKTFKILTLLAKRNPDTIEVIIAGQVFVSSDNLKNLNEYSNIEYIGVYKSPDDLGKLYGMVDIVWACYPFPEKNMWNWRWARTNRFYESCFYKKPMIGLFNSGDAAEIEYYDIGMLVKDETVEDIVKDIEKIEYVVYEKWVNNIYMVPQSVYTFDSEVSLLKENIKYLISHK